MKTNLMHTVRVLCFAALVPACVAPMYADDKMAPNSKSYSGTVTAVDAKEKVIKVKVLFLTKTFILGDNCSLVIGDKKDVAMGDFRPGQKVVVNYRDVEGVLVASQVTEERSILKGEVTAVDKNNHTFIVRHSGRNRTFQVADNCRVILNADSAGALKDLKPGQHVTVTYDTPNGQWTAREIEQKSAEYTGTLDGLNLANRSLSANKHLLGDKQFHLADNCVIVINGRLDGHLKDLQLGRNYELNYETVSGVNVVNRIALVPGPEKMGTSQQSANPYQTIPSN